MGMPLVGVSPNNTRRDAGSTELKPSLARAVYRVIRPIVAE